MFRTARGELGATRLNRWLKLHDLRARAIGIVHIETAFRIVYADLLTPATAAFNLYRRGILRIKSERRGCGQAWLRRIPMRAPQRATRHTEHAQPKVERPRYGAAAKAENSTW